MISTRELNKVLEGMDTKEQIKKFVLDKYEQGEITRRQIPLIIFDELLDTNIEENRKQELLKEIREIGIPNYEFDSSYIKTFKKLRDLDVIDTIENITDEGTIELEMKYNVFTKLASYFFPHMLSTPVNKMKSPLQAWNEDKLLIRSVNKTLKYSKGKFPNFGTLFGLLRMVSGVQTVSNFKPEISKYIYEKFSNDNDTKRIFDFSMGYGGRLTGFLSSNCNEYVGVDVNSKNFEPYKELYETYKPYMSNEKDVTVFNCPAEEFDVNSDLELENQFTNENIQIKKYKDYFDVVFSSPPYFTKELYSEDETQSCNRYGDSLDSWINGFLKPMIKNMYKLTKPNGYFIINIADIKLGNKIYDLENVTQEYSKEIGFDYVDTLYMQMGKTFGTIKRDDNGNPIDSKKLEPVFVFKK